MVTAEYQLPEHAAPARLLQSVQAMRLPHGPQTGTRQHISTQQQQANMQSHLTEGIVWPQSQSQLSAIQRHCRDHRIYLHLL